MKPPIRRTTDGMKVDFRLQFHATRVPLSGWDKLVVSLIPLETGKVSARTSRGLVRNGTCQWPDPVIESTKIPQDPSTGKCDEKLYKLLVQMGSLGVGILGETTINLSEYINADSPDALSLPLKNCNAGTLLHVKIQCLTPKRSSRGFEQQRGTSLDREDLGSVSEDDGTGSDLSESITTGSVGSSASQGISVRSHSRNSSGQMKQMRGGSLSKQKDVPSSVATSHHRSDSLDSSIYGNTVSNGPHWSDSAASQDSSNGQESTRYIYTRHTKPQGEAACPSKGWQDSYTLQTEHANSKFGPLDSDNGNRVFSSLSEKLEAAEETIQELQEETLTWKRQARKLNVEIETLKQQLVTELKNVAEHGMEVSALEAERDSLKLEVEQLKAIKLASKKRENGEDYSRWEVEDSKHLIKALQEEVSYEKEVTANLQVQLHKTQDSNSELVSALTELEETLELRNSEIDRLEEQLHKTQDCNAELVSALAELEQTIQQRNERMDVVTNNSLETRPSNETSHTQNVESGQTKWKGEELEWEQKFVAAEAQFTKKLAEKDQELKRLEAQILSIEGEGIGPNSMEVESMKLMQREKEIGVRRGKLSTVETDFMQKLMEKGNDVKELAPKQVCLEDDFGDYALARQLVENNCREDFLKAVEILKRKIEEQETDCKELTDENIELYNKLDRANKELESKMELIRELESTLHGISSFETARSSEHLLGNQMAEKEMLIHELELQLRELERENALLQQQTQKTSMDFEGRKTIFLHEGMEFHAAEKQVIESSLSVSGNRKENVDEFEGDSSEEVEMKPSKLEREKNENLKEEVKQVTLLKERLENMVLDLQLQKEELELQLQGLELESAKAYDQLSKRDAEIVKLNQDAKINAATGARLEAEVGERRAEIDKLIQELADRVASERKLEAQVMEAETGRALIETKFQELMEERGLNRSRIEELEYQLPILSEEIKLLNASKNEYQSIALKLEVERIEMQKELVEAQDESRSARERLDELVGQMAALTTTLDSQLIAKRTLERRASELESDKGDLETQVLDLEEENVQLTERISGLEAQLRYVTEQRESYKLEMENAWAQRVDHQTEKRRLEATFQEAVNEHRQQLAKLEQQQVAVSRQAENHFQMRQNLERELEQLKDELSSLKYSNIELGKNVSDLHLRRSLLEQQLQEAVNESESSKAKCTALEAEMKQQLREGKQRELAFKSEIELLNSLKEDFESRVHQAEETLSQMQAEKVAAVDRLQNELQQLTEQVSSTFDEKEKLASKALIEASELRAEKMELHDSLMYMQEKMKKMEEESVSLQRKLGFVASKSDASQELNMDLSHRLQETQALLEQMTAARADDKLKINKLEGLLSESEHQRQLLVEEVSLLSSQASELAAVKTEMENVQQRVDLISSEKYAIESSLEDLMVQCASLQREKLVVSEKLAELEVSVSEVDELKRQKSALEEKLVRFQSLLEAQEAGKTQEAEQRNELIRLKRHVSQVQRKLLEQEEEKNEFQRRVESLEDELFCKADALSRTEKQLKVMEACGGGRSLDRSSSKLGVASPSRDSKEVLELRERLLFLEMTSKAKEEELDNCRREYMEREADLFNKIECLELSNEQLAGGLLDSGAEQLKNELIRLQNQNSSLSRKEQELLSRMHTQEVLEEEVQRLQEANDLLEARLSKLIKAAENPYLLEKIVSLETELAEAIEANGLYKSQLKSVFDKQQNVSMLALQNLGDLDQIMRELVEYKKVATELEHELRVMHERYSLISLKLAEAEAERGELIMTIKHLKSIKKT